jgi:taurine dioxygenase
VNIELRKLSYPLGAEVTGVDITKTIPDAVFADIYKAYLDRCVLLFRGQKLNRDQYIAFCRRFGELDLKQAKHVEGYQEITALRNIPKTDDSTPPDHYAGSDWHSDGSFRVNPTTTTFLHAIAVPEAGGDTQFANLYLAYETLSEGMKKLLAGLEGVHMQEEKLLDHSSPERLEASRKEKTIAHPVVKIHPESGRPSLYVGDKVMMFVGMTAEESQPLIDYLNAQARRPQFVYTHQWQEDDIVVWDNRCINHSALGNFDRRTQPRHMEKIDIKGAATGHLYKDTTGTRNLARSFTF